MGDSATIPRSYAGQIGVADVTDAVKRTHAICLTQNIANSVTGVFIGDSTTCPCLFARNVTLERVMFSFYLRSTATTGTSLLAFRIMKNASTLFQSTKFNSTAQMAAVGWRAYTDATGGTLQSSRVNLSATDKIWLRITTNGPAAQIRRFNCWIRVKERTD